MIKCSLILLGGGQGKRFGSPLPKQYHPFHGLPLILHSLNTLIHVPQIQEIIVVCHEKFQEVFRDYPVLFATPGERRQDSVSSGLQKVSHPWTLVHDGARPFVYLEEISKLLEACLHNDSVALASPLPYAIKQRSPVKTLDREALALVHTPQCVKTDVLKQGLLLAQQRNLTLVDDTEAAEILSVPTKLIFATHPQIKISYPEDLTIASSLA